MRAPVADEFHEHAKTYYRKPDGRPTNGADNIANGMRYATAMYGDKPAAEFTPSMLRNVQQSMIDDDLAITTINERIRKIRQVFKWGVGMEAVPASVLTGLQAVPPLKRGRTEAREPDPVGPVHRSVVDATLPHLPGVVRAMVEIQWLTGMRSSELCTMRGCDIDTAGTVWVYRPASHKGEHHGREKEIPLGPKAQGIIRPYLKPDLQAYLFSPREALRERHADAKCHRRPDQKPTPRKTDRTVGERYDRTSYRRAIDRAITAANKAGKAVPSWTPHMLRHAAATRLRKTHGIEATRLILGHTSASTTEIYAEIDKAKAVQIAAEAG